MLSELSPSKRSENIRYNDNQLSLSDAVLVRINHTECAFPFDVDPMTRSIWREHQKRILHGHQCHKELYRVHRCGFFTKQHI